MAYRNSDAVLAINPNASFDMVNDAVDSIVWNNGTTPISAADIAAKKKELDDGEAAKKVSDKNNRNSGKDKLKALGLSDDEIAALLGAKES